MTLEDSNGKEGLIEVFYTSIEFMLVKKGVFESMEYPWFRPIEKQIGDAKVCALHGKKTAPLLKFITSHWRFFMTTTQDYIQKSSDGTAVSHLEDSIIYQDDANSRIGIGLTSPSENLEVKGTIKATTADVSPGTVSISQNDREVTGVSTSFTTT
jgi:hypothetical protein